MWGFLQPEPLETAHASPIDTRLEKRYNDVKHYLPEGVALRIERGESLSEEERRHPAIRRALELWGEIRSLVR